MIKKTICLVLAFVFVLLTGCKDTNETSADISSLPVDETIVSTGSHTIYRSGEEFYLRFFDVPGKAYDMDLEFLSVEDLRLHLLDGDFSPRKIRNLQARACDEAGNIRIFNINNMHQPKCPEEFVTKKVLWDGFPSYICKVESVETGFDVTICYTEDSFEQEHKEREEFFANLGEEYTVTKLDYRNAVEYRSDIDKYICYDIETDGRSIRVEEYYWLTDKYGYKISDTIPFQIYMTVAEEGVNYTVGMDHLYTVFTEHPGEEWLLSFGMEPFVPEE